MVTILTGGGYGSRQHTDKKSGMKVEPKAHAANVAGVAQQGMATAFKKEPLVQGKGYEPAQMRAVDRPSYKGPTMRAQAQTEPYTPAVYRRRRLQPVRWLQVEMSSTNGLTRVTVPRCGDGSIPCAYRYLHSRSCLRLRHGRSNPRR
jgi:hypothetical protein